MLVVGVVAVVGLDVDGLRVEVGDGVVAADAAYLSTNAPLLAMLPVLGCSYPTTTYAPAPDGSYTTPFAVSKSMVPYCRLGHSRSPEALS